MSEAQNMHSEIQGSEVKGQKPDSPGSSLWALNVGQRISVIIPAYNEEERILACVQETARALEGVDYEIIVVDDGSVDNTYEEVAKAARDDANVKAVRYDENLGKGHALRYGFGFTAGDLVAFLDADLDLHPAQLWTLWGVMERSGADVVIGSKRHPESKLDYPWQRRFVSWGYFTLVHLLFRLSIHDTQTGIKLFKREVLERVFPRMQIQRFAHDLELLVGVHRFGYRIAEAPVTLSFQPGKFGAMGLKSIIEISLDTMRVFYWASFWRWLAPGLAVKCWLVAFMVGVFCASFGLAHWLITLAVPSPLAGLVRILALQFLDKTVRDAVLLIVGLILIVAAAIELNKHVLAAFARLDESDLTEITRSKVQSPRSEAGK